MARGHIFKRYNNTWSIVVELQKDRKTGKRQQKWYSVKGSKRDAERRLSDIIRELDASNFRKPAKLTFGIFLERWLTDYVATRVRPSTQESYTHWIRKQVIPALGRIPLTELQPDDLQWFYREAMEGGRIDGKGSLSAQSVVHIHRVIHAALSTAVEWGYLSRNVASIAKPPRALKKEVRTLNPEEISRVLDMSGDTIYHTFIYTAIYTGARRGELLALRWRDCDLGKGKIHICRSLHYSTGKGIVIHDPKTRSGKREISISPAVVGKLREHKERQDSERLNLLMNDINIGLITPDDLVFANIDGMPLLPSSVSHAVMKIVRRAGLRGVRVHDLRHTNASLLLRYGANTKIVQERLGHSSIQITADIYQHLTPGLQERAALNFEEGLAQEIEQVRAISKNSKPNSKPSFL